MAQFPELMPGLSGTIQHWVDKKSTARQLGSGTVDVLATPELVRLMEIASLSNTTCKTQRKTSAP